MFSLSIMDRNDQQVGQKFSDISGIGGATVILYGTCDAQGLRSSMLDWRGGLPGWRWCVGVGWGDNHVPYHCIHAWCYGRFNLLTMQRRLMLQKVQPDVLTLPACLMLQKVQLFCTAECQGRFNLLALKTCLVLRKVPLAMHSNKSWLSVTMTGAVETRWNTADLPGAKPNKHLGSS